MKNEKKKMKEKERKMTRKRVKENGKANEIKEE